MSTMEPDETDDRIAIGALLAAYADGVNRRAWADVRGLFRPAATLTLDLVTRPSIDLAGPAAITDFIEPAIERFSFFQFVILNAHVDLWPDGDHDAATARVFMCELRATPDGRDDAFGLYRDRYARVDDQWRFAGRRYRSMARFPAGDVYPLPPDVGGPAS